MAAPQSASHALLVARILNLPTDPLGLRHAAARLDSPQNAALHRQFGPHLEEFLSLAEEPNSEMFHSGLLNLGMRLEASDRLEAAAAVYQALGAAETGAAASIVQRAETQLGAMRGVGSSGARAEFLLRRLARETTEPATLFGMGMAGAAFRATRLATLSRLAATPAGNFFTRGFGAQAAASIAGFGVEGVVFPLATRLGHVSLGRSLDWSPAQLGSELVGSYLILGALKLSGWGATSVFNRVHGAARGVGASATQHWRTVPLRHFYAQGGMLGGIYLGHQAETALGLRPHLDNATTAIDSLAMLLQFNAAGHLSRQAFGERFQNWERELDLRFQTTRALEVDTNRPALDWALVGPGLRFAGTRPQGSRRGDSSREIFNNGIRMMTQGPGGGDDGAGGPPKKPRRDTLTGVGGGAKPPAPPRRPSSPNLPAAKESEALPLPERPTAPNLPRVKEPTAPTLPQLPTTQPPPGRLRPPEVREGTTGGTPPPPPAHEIAAISPLALPYRVEGLPSHTRYFRITGISRNPVPLALELIERQLREEPEASFFELDQSLDVRAQGQMRIELHRVFRDTQMPEGVLVTIALPREDLGLLFSKRSGMLHVHPVSLVRRRANLPPTRPPTPAPPAPGSPDTAASGKRPPTGPIPTISRRPTPAPFRTSSGADLRTEGVNCYSPEELRETLRDVLRKDLGQWDISPAIRLLRGHLTERDLSNLAQVLLEDPLPEGKKITIFWGEIPAGRLILQRDGDRILAQFRGGTAPETSYILLPKDFNRNEIVIHPAGHLKAFDFNGLGEYEARAQLTVNRLVLKLGAGPNRLAHEREEGSSSRGSGLAFIIQHLLKGRSNPELPMTRDFEELFIAVQRQLEEAYTVFDFGTIEYFLERVGHLNQHSYRLNLAALNRTLEKRTQPPLVPLEEMPLQAPGFDWVPHQDHLKEIYLRQLFAGSGGIRSPRENIGLLSDPQRLGKVLAATFRSHFTGFLPKRAMVVHVARGETLETLLTPGRTDLTPPASQLRDQLQSYLQDIPEFYRILMSGKGHFHRAVLTAFLEGEQNVAELYRHVHSEVYSLSPGLRGALKLPVLPTLDQTHEYLQKFRPRK